MLKNSRFEFENKSILRFHMDIKFLYFFFIIIFSDLFLFPDYYLHTNIFLSPKYQGSNGIEKWPINLSLMIHKIIDSVDKISN